MSWIPRRSAPAEIIVDEICAHHPPTAVSNQIKEHCYTNESWFDGEKSLPTAVTGSGLAAIAYEFQGTLQHRLYYQADVSTIREYAFNNDSWGPG